MEDKLNVVICDLDGTLSLFEKVDKSNVHYRNPYDASTCYNDLLNEVVASIIKGRNVLLVSGREDKYRPETIKFLENNKIQYLDLFMRRTGDLRKDNIVKGEIYHNNIKFFYNVDFVLDDRLQVCRMWYSLGLPLLRFGDPDSDF